MSLRWPGMATDHRHLVDRLPAFYLPGNVETRPHGRSSLPWHPALSVEDRPKGLETGGRVELAFPPRHIAAGAGERAEEHAVSDDAIVGHASSPPPNACGSAAAQDVHRENTAEAVGCSGLLASRWPVDLGVVP